MAKRIPGRQFRYVYRDAGTGNFVSEAYAKANPKTTIRQRVRVAGVCA